MAESNLITVDIDAISASGKTMTATEGDIQLLAGMRAGGDMNAMDMPSKALDDIKGAAAVGVTRVLGTGAFVDPATKSVTTFNIDDDAITHVVKPTINSLQTMIRGNNGQMRAATDNEAKEIAGKVRGALAIYNSEHPIGMRINLPGQFEGNGLPSSLPLSRGQSKKGGIDI